MDFNILPEKLYHGTTTRAYDSLVGVDGKPLIERSKPYLDNSKGFYTTGITNQVVKHSSFKTDLLNNRIKMKIDSGNSNYQFVEAMVIEYKLNKDALEKYCNNPLVLLDKNVRWGKFILNNRVRNEALVDGLHNRNMKFDMVYSAMADGSMKDIMERYESDTKDKAKRLEEALEEMTQEFRFGKSEQVSFHNDYLISQVLEIEQVYKGKDIYKLL